MIEFTLDDFEATKPKTSEYLGLYDIPMAEYQNADFLANSELQLFKQSASDYIWNKSAPIDTKKATTADFGTALHTRLLEPHLFEDSIIVSSTKGRTAQAFIDMQNQNPDKIILTSDESDQIELMAESANAHPMYKYILAAKGKCESSIFVNDPRTGLNLKIRPDKIVNGKSQPLFCDVKSTADIEKWRMDRQWLNPLFDMGYGFTAAYYLYVGSIHYGIELNKYAFLVSSKSVLLGRYPVSVFIITKDELIEYGFWDEMIESLDKFAEFKAKDNWTHFEHFPHFDIYDDGEIEVKDI